MKNRLQFTFKTLIKDQTFEFKYYYFFGIICLFLTHKIQSELPFMASNLAHMVDSKNVQVSLSQFFWFALGIIIFRTSSRILFFYPARILQKYLREELLVKIQNANPVRYKSISSGQLFQYLTGDIDQIRALIGFVGLQGGNFVIGLLVLIPKMVSFNAGLMWALTPMLVAFAIFTVIVSKNKEYFKKMQEAQGEVQNIIIESYQGKKTIKNFQSEEAFISMFNTSSLKELFYFYRSSLAISFTLPLITFGIGLSMIWGAYIIKVNNLGASNLILFSGFIFLFMEPMGYLSWIGVVVSRSHASWKRLHDLDNVLVTETEEEKDLKRRNIHSTKSEFNFDFWGMDLDLKIKPNALNVLVSKTGHGKTVLLEKMAQVLKDHEYKVSMVFQDPYIYNDTVVNNIFLGREVSVQLIDDAKFVLKIMGLEYLEPNLDKLLTLEVGENGKRLSGGQAKRLALTRSLLSDAEVILWDDPFSSVDLILEKEILSKLKTLDIIKNKTFVMTSHRLTTVRGADFVIFLDNEKGIVEEGDTKSLLTESSLLYEYFKQQMV